MCDERNRPEDQKVFDDKAMKTRLSNGNLWRSEEYGRGHKTPPYR